MGGPVDGLQIDTDFHQRRSSPPSVFSMASDDPLSKEETQLYDRQLRLWGVQSQQRLQQSKVALIGLNAVQSEIAKNIILAGLNELTIFDWVKVEPRHTIPHLFLDPKSSIGQNVRLKRSASFLFAPFSH